MRARLVKARYSKSTMYLKFDCSLINLSVSFSVYVSCPPVYTSNPLKLQHTLATKTLLTREIKISINFKPWVPYGNGILI